MLLLFHDPDPPKPAHRRVVIDELQIAGYSGCMKLAHQKVFEEALRLPTEARAALAGHLLESLDSAVDEDVELAWSKEIARRIDDQGKVKTVSWTVARRQILGLSGGRAKN